MDGFTIAIVTFKVSKSLSTFETQSYRVDGPVPDTSSTAQGGGGSFKIRKPIGQVGGCESRMAERMHRRTERWLKLFSVEWLQWLQRSPHPQLLDVVWCSAVEVIVVVWCSGVVVVMIEGSLEVKLPTIWTVEKQR